MMANPHSRKAYRLLAVSCLSPLLLVASSSAVEAQSNSSDAETDILIEEIVVTARRRAENLQEVPIAVTAIGGAALEERGAIDLTDIARITPSTTLEATRATNTTLTAFIRGVGQQDPLAGFEQGVGIYIDDVYLARPQGALLDIYDVERIEVLRGPQGTLYGRNAVGGAIKYATRKLSDESTASIKFSLGSHSQTDLIGTFSVPASSTFRIGGALASLQRDGYGENLDIGTDNYNKDILAYRLSADLDATPSLGLRFALDSTADNSNPVYGFRVRPGALSGVPITGSVFDSHAAAEAQPSTQGIDGSNEINSDGFSVHLDWEINDWWRLRSITASRDDYTESVIDFDSLPVQDFDGAVIYENSQFSQEIQLLYSSDKLNLVTGFYLLDAAASNDFDVVLSQLGVTAYTGGEVDTSSWSLFADATYDFSDRLSGSAGMRYTDDTRDADIYRAAYLGIGSAFFGVDNPLIAVTSDFENSRTFTNLSPRLGISWKSSDRLMLYGSYSQGWKAGSFDPRGASTPDNPEKTVEEGYDDETLDTTEFGIKTTGSRTVLNAAVFFSTYTDMQIPGSVGVDRDGDNVNDDFVGTVTNAGEAEINGIEVEGRYLFNDKAYIQYALSLLDAAIIEWPLSVSVPDPDNPDETIVVLQNIATDRVVQNTPETMLYLAVHFDDIPVAGGSLSLSPNLTHKSDIAQYEVPAEDIDQPAYTLLNFNAFWMAPSQRWTLAMHLRNITDEEIRTAGYCFGLTGCPSGLGLEDNTTVFYAPPFTWTASFNWRF